MGEAVRIVRQDALEAGPTSPGVARQTAVAAEGVWVGEAHTEPGARSGWHHHGEHTTYGRVLSGHIEFEFGEAGVERVLAGPGDYFVVPPHCVHREGNPHGEVQQVVVVVRLGSGPSVINVDGPETTPTGTKSR